jgi:protein SCO1/2
MKFTPGKEFEVVTISIDPREKPQLAAAKKETYMGRYGREEAANGWHFLTGDEANIKKLTDAAGFRYQWDPKMQQFAHAAGIMLATPEGKLAQYYYGVEYSARDIRLGVIEASKERVGNLADQVLLYCYHYDPQTGRYGAVISNIMRLAGLMTTVVLGGFLIVMFRREGYSRAKGTGRA